MAKGIGFLHVRAFVEERFSASGWEQLGQRLSEDDRTALRSLTATGWYSLALYARLLHAVQDTFGWDEHEIIRQQARYQAERDLKVIFRVFFRLANPSYVVSKATEFWNRLQSAGTWTIEREGASKVRGTLDGWGVDRLLCVELVAYMERLIELVGGKNVVGEHPACRAQGQPSCVYTLRWRE